MKVRNHSVAQNGTVRALADGVAQIAPLLLPCRPRGRGRYGIVAALALLAGCSAVREARDAQASVEEKSRDDHLVSQIASRPEGETSAIALPLPDGVAFALTNRPSVITSRLAVDAARLTMKQIASEAPLVSETPWNALDASVSASWNAQESEKRFRDLDGRTHGDPSAGLSLDILVYDFGRNAASARAQAERVIAAEQDLVAAGYAVFEEVASASFSCREKLALLAAAETNEFAFLNRLQQVESRLQQGEAMNLDLLKAKLDHARACEDLVAASNQVRTAFAEFRHALGVPAAQSSSEDDFRMVLARERLSFPYDDPVTLARTNAPAMRIARARLRAASAAVDRAVADLYPTLTASASFSWTDPLWIFAWGGRAVQSLFQGFRTTTEVELATVALRQAEADVDTAEQDLMRSLELALAARANAREAERAARQSFASAEENLTLVAEQNRLGEAHRVELTDAINAVAEARGSIATAISNGQKAEASLFVLTGTAPVYISNEQKK